MVIPLSNIGPRDPSPPPAEPATPEVWLVTGIPGAGKTTVSRALALRWPAAAHIEGDELRRWIVNGVAWPDPELEGEAARQYELAIRNQCLLARSYAEAGFTPVLDHCVVTASHLDAYLNYLAGGTVHLVVLAPTTDVVARRDAERPDKTVGDQFMHLDGVMREELAGRGLWIDSSDLSVEQTVDAILDGREQARIA